MHDAPTNETLLKQTTSMCPACLAKVPARMIRADGQVVLEKSCDVHGVQRVVVASDAAFYWQGGDAAGCGPGGCALTNHSCTLIIEITDHCNLSCPACFAASSPEGAWFMSLEELDRKLSTLHGHGKGDADIVQLSGGEPTLHPELEAMIDLCFARGVSRVYVNTNGIRLATDEALCRRLSQYSGRLQFYLQLDGLRRDTMSKLRGAAGLGTMKSRAVANAVAADLYVMPVMTVTRSVNFDEIGDVIRFCLEHHPNLNALILQPAFYSGRFDAPKDEQRLDVAGLALAVEEQSGGLFSAADFGPIPCSDPNCFALAVALKHEDRLIPVSRYFPRHETWSEPAVAERVARFADRLPHNLMDELAEDELVDQLLGLLAGDLQDPEAFRDYRSWFSIGIKPFMDAHTYDQDRVDACCCHIVDREGIPVSFCEYNALRRPRGLL